MKETENNAYLWEDGSEECEGDAFHKVPSVWSWTVPVHMYYSLASVTSSQQHFS